MCVCVSKSVPKTHNQQVVIRNQSSWLMLSTYLLGSTSKSNEGVCVCVYCKGCLLEQLFWKPFFLCSKLENRQSPPSYKHPSSRKCPDLRCAYTPENQRLEPPWKRRNIDPNHQFWGFHVSFWRCKCVHFGGLKYVLRRYTSAIKHSIWYHFRC